MEPLSPFDAGDGRRPSMMHRTSSAQQYDFADGPRRSRTSVAAPSVVASSRNYILYTIHRGKPDWEARPRIEENRAPQSEIMQKVKKGKGGDGPISKQLQTMQAFRKECIYDLITELDEQEQGRGHWEPVYIKSTKKENNVVMKFDLVLHRKVDPRARSPSKERLTRTETLETVDFKESPGPRGRGRRAPLERDSYFNLPVDPVVNDPFGVQAVFSKDGLPMDERGPIEYGNAGLPPEIPKEQPMGAKPKKDKHKDGSKGKKDYDADGIEILPFEMNDEDIVDLGGAFEDLTMEEIGSDDIIEVGDDKRGRRSKSGTRPEIIEIIGGQRSHSRKRPSKSGTRYVVTKPRDRSNSHSRSRSRSKSKRRSSRAGPQRIVVMHNGRRETRDRRPTIVYHDGASRSSESGESRNGYSDHEERSSRTSSDTHYVAHRGSLHHEGQDYLKQHRPGPKYRQRAKTYHEEPHVVIPASTFRRMSEVGYERRYRPIPENRPLAIEYRPPPREPARYPGPPPISPRYELPPELLYPHEDRTVREVYRDPHRERESEQQIEDYQRRRIREDYFNRLERDLARGERDIDYREDESRRRQAARYRSDGGYGGYPTEYR